MYPLLSTAYLPPISYMALLIQGNGGKIEAEENFEKQSYRNRCLIYGPNGIQSLSVPVQHTGGKIKIKDLKISYQENWQKSHWKSMVSAYKGRPFFDILGEDLKSIWDKKPTFLFDLNQSFLNLILDWLQADAELEISKSFMPPGNSNEDFRFSIHPKKESILLGEDSYFQHFSMQHGFIKDLSVVDLVFSEGRASWDYLNSVDLKNS